MVISEKGDGTEQTRTVMVFMSECPYGETSHSGRHVE